jgi:hypothetical protein
MSAYTAKLVDHTGSGLETFKSGIQRLAQETFDQAFDGTADKVTISWGAGTQSDNLVIHFVEDIAHSYIRQKWPSAAINADAGGHTHIASGPLCATELYKMAQGRRQHVRELGLLAFHEALHNLLPSWGMEQMHNLDGGGEKAGLAAAKISPDSKMTEHNKQLIRQGFSTKHDQYL